MSQKPDGTEMANSRQCSAKSKRSGNRCLRVVPEYGKVCASHGGRAPQTISAVRRRRVLAEAAAEVRARGFQPVEDAPRTLQFLAGEAMALKDNLAARIAELSSTDLIHVDRDGRENLSAILAAYRETLKDVTSAVVQLVKLDVPSRVAVDLDVERGRRVAVCVENAVYSERVGLTDDQIEAVMAEFAAEVRRAFDDVVDAEEVPAAS
jgi:hypothetical protein